MEKHILFVDDEINILRSIRRIFIRTKYKLFIANSAKEALNILEEHRIDLVVSDVKMPEMNGLEFLRIVKKKYPEINRVILSGYVEKEEVLKAILLGVASKYIVKPWDSDMLIKEVDNIFFIRETLNNKNLQALINDIEQLPKLPNIYHDFLNAVNENKSIEKISDIILEDIGLSTELLQLVNSAFYTGEHINSIKKAISLIGLNHLKNLMLFTSVSKEGDVEKELTPFFEGLIKELKETNKLFIKLYKLNLGQIIPENISSVGITFDIGKLIQVKYMPKKVKAILNLVESEGVSYEYAEKALWKESTHSEIGGYFLELWNFPKESIEMALFHNCHSFCSEKNRNIAYLLDSAHKLIKENDWQFIDSLYDYNIEEWNSSDDNRILEIKRGLIYE